MLSSSRDGFTSSGSTPMEPAVINDAAPFLPEDIITNILKRLPVKSLLRFQCVCKYWKNLFKTPSFIQDHLRHSTYHNPSVLIGPDDRDDGFYLFSFNCDMQFHQFEIAPLIGSLVGLCLVGSCNGLLCFADRSEHPLAPLLWNPATRRVRQMPITSDDSLDLGRLFGFGFSRIINDYKIVRVSMSSLVCKVEVYSLSIGSWRNIQFDNIKDVSVSEHGVAANGVLFWPAIKYIMGAYDGAVIVSFDLATEVFKVIPWPAFLAFGRLAVYNDKLAIISYLQTRKYPFYLEPIEDYFYLYFVVMEEGAIGSSGERWSSSIRCMGNSDISLCDGTIWKNQIVCVDFGSPVFTESGTENTERLYLIDMVAKECKQFE